MTAALKPVERVGLALDHREPDRVPYDLWGIDVAACESLRAHLGLPPGDNLRFSGFNEILQRARVEPDLLDAFDVDVDFVVSDYPPLVIEEDGEYLRTHDEWGIERRKAKVGGWWYDMVSHPLAGDISLEAVDAYSWPDAKDPARYDGMRKQALAAREERGRAVAVRFAGGGGTLELLTWLRGYEDGFVDLIARPKLAEKVMDKVLEVKLAFWDEMLRRVGDVADVVVEGDDLGTQEQLLVSADTYRKLIKPRHRELFEFIHARTRAKICFHSDGAIRPLIPDLIEIGVDALNPVQFTCAGMSTPELKAEFGRDLVFWGAGVDTQGVLEFGTPQDVAEQVKRQLEALMPGGGFVFAQVQNIQRNVPPANLVAMRETVAQYGRYR